MVVPAQSSKTARKGPPVGAAKDEVHAVDSRRPVPQGERASARPSAFCRHGFIGRTVAFDGPLGVCWGREDLGHGLQRPGRLCPHVVPDGRRRPSCALGPSRRNGCGRGLVGSGHGKARPGRARRARRCGAPGRREHRHSALDEAPEGCHPRQPRRGNGPALLRPERVPSATACDGGRVGDRLLRQSRRRGADRGERTWDRLPGANLRVLGGLLPGARRLDPRRPAAHRSRPEHRRRRLGAHAARLPQRPRRPHRQRASVRQLGGP